MNLDDPILIVGFGSIGRRHLRNLQSLGYKNLILLRSGKSTLDLNEIKGAVVEFDLEKALLHKPIAAIIANPTALHIEAALAAAKAGVHLFLEKPISHNLDGIEGLRQLVKDKNLVVQVGYQFRFHPRLQKIKKLLEKDAVGKVVSVQAHCGEYLPDWHPGEDYKQSYSARKELGGGVILTLCHPFDYLRWLFGEVISVSAFQPRVGKLEIDVEESADVLLNFESGIIGNVHLDYLQQPPEHYLRITGQKGIIHWNNLDGFDRNQLFLSEMRHFIDCITKNEQALCSLEDGIKALEIALAAKKSAKTGRSVRL